MTEKKKYDSTLARMAGNIASGMMTGNIHPDTIAERSIKVAKAIVLQLEQEAHDAEYVGYR